ncbi:hypothetical protein [Mangrovibrevibacter kandeliae]|uniref:hypothetical protein n=1 Tax=Mangrovibrevibacter kandeliae TaxID=2968473 RepID=UPI0021190270|nr:MULTISPECIES: hypothetical protein [unclassified Aurantimonas]MCQ8781816.1 hypothetical protein [Aurantimonas sp. CSK15Z-1]MCW4115527.1 hypothetical protein [Aurantimonas sp. MSK8Z-1]
MNFSKASLLALALTGGLAAPAFAQPVTPYPNQSPITGARIGANDAPRGSVEFCRTYARQTAANAYEDRISRDEDGFGVRAFNEQQASRDGNDAFERCLARHR